jgi:hypothetical protein
VQTSPSIRSDSKSDPRGTRWPSINAACFESIAISTIVIEGSGRR